MSRYLDHEQLPAILRQYYSEELILRSRMVGADQQFESAYFNIVRFFGPNGLKPADIQIEYRDLPFEFEDRRIAEFSRYVESELRSEERLYEGPPVMKLMSVDASASRQVMRVQPARYGDQAGSCFALDLKHELFQEWGGTLRQYLLRTNPEHAPQRNPLAVCLGVAGYLRLADEGGEYLLGVKRSGKLASLESSLGPSVAGSVDWRTDCVNLEELIVRSLQSELQEELGLSASEYRIVPLAYGTEILRGERPQLFALVESKVSRTQLGSRLEQLPADSREFSSFDFLPLSEGRLSGQQTTGLNFEAQACYFLAEEYLAGQKRAAR